MIRSSAWRAASPNADRVSATFIDFVAIRVWACRARIRVSRAMAGSPSSSSTKPSANSVSPMSTLSISVRMRSASSSVSLARAMSPRIRNARPIPSSASKYSDDTLDSAPARSHLSLTSRKRERARPGSPSKRSMLPNWLRALDTSSELWRTKTSWPHSVFSLALA